MGKLLCGLRDVVERLIALLAGDLRPVVKKEPLYSLTCSQAKVLQTYANRPLYHFENTNTKSEKHYICISSVLYYHDRVIYFINYSLSFIEDVTNYTLQCVIYSYC